MNIEFAKAWYRQAKHDLDVAKQNRDLGNYDVSVYYSEQAHELLDKAIAIMQGKPLKYIHNTLKLANDINAPPLVIESGGTSQREHIDARYPCENSNIAPFEKYTLVDANDRINRASIIFEELKSKYLELEDD